MSSPTSSLPFIPVNTPLVGERERELLKACIDTGWISSDGPFVREFEDRFAERVGRRHAVAVTNGSAALEAAVVALGLGPGDEVIVPSFTIISCAAAVVRAGAVPVFVDCDPRTWTMDVDQVAQRISSRTRAIMVVHIYGLPVDLDPVMTLAERHGLLVIEDAAQAHGLEYRGKRCGGFGALSTFSFYPNKLITTGEGGMIVTDDDALAQRCRSLRNLCFQPERRFVHEELGWNLRITNLQAAVGLAQLEAWDNHVRRKREIGARYQRNLAGVNGIQLPTGQTDYAQNIYWVFGVVLDDGLEDDAASMATRLAEAGVGTRPFFWPMHEQPVLRRMGYGLEDRLPVSERIARRGLYLPSGLGVSDDEIDRASETLRSMLA